MDEPSSSATVHEPSQEAISASGNVPLRRRRAQSNTKVDYQKSQERLKRLQEIGQRYSRLSNSGKSGGEAESSTLIRLHSYAEVPDYLQDNEFIHGYYRNNMPVRATLKSLFKLHNETGNVWTHLIGFILFVALTVCVFQAPPSPLALATPQIDALWDSVRGNVATLRHSLHHSVEENLNFLQDSLVKQVPKLHALQESVQVGVHSLQDTLQEGVHTLQDTLHEGVHSLQEGVHTLQDNLRDGGSHALRSLQAGLSHPYHALINAHLVDSLAGVLSWPVARWPTYVFMAGAMICLLLSSVCHLFGCCQKHVALLIWRFDYAGIAILIVASFYPPVYYGFMCAPLFCLAYLGVVTVLGVMTVAVSLMDVFQLPEWRVFRASLFTGLGFFGVVPLLHLLLQNSDVWHVRQALVYDVGMGLLYLAGAGIFALRVPERWLPGRFDILLHSHQIFHVAVVAAAYLHYRSVLLLLEWRDASGGCATRISSSGPLTHWMDQMKEAGHHALGIEQVWDRLLAYAHEHVGLPQLLAHHGQQ